MFKALVTVPLLLCGVAGGALAQVPDDVVIQPVPVAPFKIYSTDPDTPSAPTGLDATADGAGVWTVTWETPVDENDDPIAVDDYIVYYLVDGLAWWEETTVDGSLNQVDLSGISGPAVVTVVAQIDEDTSEAWEYIVIGGVGGSFSCPLTTISIQPPPPEALVHPHCVAL